MTLKQDYMAVRKRIAAAPHHFAMLGVHKASTVEEIQRARNALVRVVHPDRLIPAGILDWEDLAARINAAADVLMDTKKRKLYLAELAAGRSKCPTCQGTGTVRQQRSMKNVVFVTCTACQGCGML